MSEKIGVRSCALCGRPVDPEYRPFCSARCADLDLGNWLSGAYVIPSVQRLSCEEEEEEELEQVLRSFESFDSELS